jgi:hypothetical protein
MQHDRERKESDNAARLEARSIVSAMKHGVDMTEELNISRDTQINLEAFCKEYPGDAYIVRNAIEFRSKVRENVDLLLAGQDWGDDAEEVEAAESDASEATEHSIQGAEESSVSEAEAQG